MPAMQQRCEVRAATEAFKKKSHLVLGTEKEFLDEVPRPEG